MRRRTCWLSKPLVALPLMRSFCHLALIIRQSGSPAVKLRAASARVGLVSGRPKLLVKTTKGLFFLLRCTTTFSSCRAFPVALAFSSGRHVLNFACLNVRQPIMYGSVVYFV